METQFIDTANAASIHLCQAHRLSLLRSPSSILLTPKAYLASDREENKLDVFTLKYKLLVPIPVCGGRVPLQPAWNCS